MREDRIIRGGERRSSFSSVLKEAEGSTGEAGTSVEGIDG